MIASATLTKRNGYFNINLNSNFKAVFSSTKHHSSCRLPLQILPPAAKQLFKDKEDAESDFFIFEVTPTALGQISFGARIHLVKDRQRDPY
jgi:hypothetical protein